MPGTNFLQIMDEGIEKSEISEKLGYQTPLSLDNYMRRRNYAWDSRQKKYVPAAEKYYGKTNANILQLNGVSKVDVVLSLFDQGELKVKDIAKQVGFENNLELAKFMKGKGYQWDPVIGNYVKSNELIIEPVITETSGTQFSQNATLAGPTVPGTNFGTVTIKMFEGIGITLFQKNLFPQLPRRCQVRLGKKGKLFYNSNQQPPICSPEVVFWLFVNSWGGDSLNPCSFNV